MGFERVDTGLSGYGPGPACIWRHWEYDCTSDPETGNRTCTETAHEEGEIPTVMATGDPCPEPVQELPEEPIEP